MNDVLSMIKSYIIIVFTFIFAIFGGNIYDESPKDAIAEPDTVRIMSFNIRSGEYEPRFTYVPELIRDYKPDSVGVQECTYSWISTLGTFLPEYSVVGVGRDEGAISINGGEISAILFLHAKYKLIDSGTFWISETPDEVSFGWDAACRRVCTWAILENRETGERYAHVNTHLDHVGNIAREKGAEMVSEFAMSFDIPVVVTGDFNFSKGCDWYNSIIDAGLTDTQDVAAETMNGKTYHAYKGGEEGLPIDFIFTNDKIETVYTYKIIRDMHGDEYISDHYPIYADMKL